MKYVTLDELYSFNHLINPILSFCFRRHFKACAGYDGMLCGSTCPAIETRKCNVLCFSDFQVEHYLASDVSLRDESPCNSKNRQESDYFSIFYCFGALDLIVFVFVP